MFVATSSIIHHPSSFADSGRIATDVQDPLFLNRQGDFVTRTAADIGDYFQARQSFSYGFSDRFAVSADLRYRLGDDDRDRNGWNGIGVTGTYRVGQGNTGITDVIFGFGYGPHGVIPEFSEETYRVGFRTGRQWDMITLSATVMTNWIFHEHFGQAYIDLTPEIYFRLPSGYSTGFGATIRRSTNVGPFNQNWFNYMFGATIGRTGWFLTTGYETREGDFRVGGNINMLF